MTIQLLLGPYGPAAFRERAAALHLPIPSRYTVTAWRTGRQLPAPAHYATIAAVLGCSIHDVAAAVLASRAQRRCLQVAAP